MPRNQRKSGDAASAESAVYTLNTS